MDSVNQTSDESGARRMSTRKVFAILSIAVVVLVAVILWRSPEREPSPESLVKSALTARDGLTGIQTERGVTMAANFADAKVLHTRPWNRVW